MISSNILLLLLLNLFIIGIKKVSILFFFKFKLLPLKSEYRKDLSNFSIAVILGIFIFCILSNLILLLPSFIFFISNSATNIDNYVNFSTNLLKIIVIILSFIGGKELIKIYKSFKSNIKKTSFEYDKNLLISLFITTSIYLIFAPKSIASGIHFDTGLYHLPFINHLSKYAIEPGLANLHFRYGFYGISFFGQVPFQLFSNNSNFLSPSLNIGYMAIYISYFLPYFNKLRLNSINKILKNEVIFLEKINSISILYFCLSMILFTGGIFKSLSSYSLDLPLFICGSLGFHLVLLSFFKGYNYLNFIPIFWLSFFGPIIKLTGITISLFFFLLLFFRWTNTFIKEHKKDRKKNLLKSLNQSFGKGLIFFYDLRLLINYKLSLIIIFITILTFILTNLVITGYPLYPTEFLGSFHNYSIDPEVIENIKIGTLNWHRFQNKPFDSNSWILIYLNTRNGFINILFWFIPCSASLILTSSIKRFYRNHKFRIQINNLLFSLTTTILFCFFTLIPLVNYYPWTPHIIVFLMLILLNRIMKLTNIRINFSKLTFVSLLLFIILNTFFSYSNYLIFKNIPYSIFKEPILQMPKYEQFDLEPKNWVSFGNSGPSKNVKVSVPIDGNQCWGIEPPCANSKSLLKKL